MVGGAGLNQGRFVWSGNGAPSVGLTRAQFDALVLGLPWQHVGEGPFLLRNWQDPPRASFARRTRPLYFPVNRGGRFSLNARTPSSRSCSLLPLTTALAWYQTAVSGSAFQPR